MAIRLWVLYSVWWDSADYMYVFMFQLGGVLLMVENDDGIGLIIFFINHSFLVDCFHSGVMVNEVC